LSAILAAVPRTA